MAITTIDEKLAVLNLDNILEAGLVINEASPFSQGDKQQLLWGYPGVLWAETAAVVPEPSRGARGGGAKLFPEDNRHRRREIESMYALLSGEQLDVPEEMAEEASKKAAEIVRPFAKTKAKKPKPNRVDWAKMSVMADAVERMISLYGKVKRREQAILEDEEAAILLLMS